MSDMDESDSVNDTLDFYLEDPDDFNKIFNSSDSSYSSGSSDSSDSSDSNDTSSSHGSDMSFDPRPPRKPRSATTSYTNQDRSESLFFKQYIISAQEVGDGSIHDDLSQLGKKFGVDSLFPTPSFNLL